MKHTKYTGFFKSAEGHEYTLTAYGFGFIQAFFLLTAEAIKTGQHYQLYSITSEDGVIKRIDDILKVGALIS